MITLLQQKASFLLQPIVAVCKLAIPLPPILMLGMHVSVALHTTLIQVKSTSASSDSLKASASCTAFHVDQCSTAMSDKGGDEVGARAFC